MASNLKDALFKFCIGLFLLWLDGLRPSIDYGQRSVSHGWRAFGVRGRPTGGLIA